MTLYAVCHLVNGFPLSRRNITARVCALAAHENLWYTQMVQYNRLHCSKERDIYPLQWRRHIANYKRSNGISPHIAPSDLSNPATFQHVQRRSGHHD